MRSISETIGIELELEAREKEVGPFRAGILRKATINDHWVLIENQLERTDLRTWAGYRPTQRGGSIPVNDG